MVDNAIFTFGLLFFDDPLDSRLLLLDIAGSHDLTIALSFILDAGLTIGSERICSGGCEGATIVSALLVVSLAVCDSGLFLTPK